MTAPTPPSRGEQIDVTIGGKTRTVTMPTLHRRAPADWDQARSVLATAGTALAVCGALAWSVYAIGDLLSALAPPVLAYGIAAVFDLAWILCMAAEYELRYQPSRLRGPRALGWVLLAASVTVIFTHGYRVADLAVASSGAVIAVLAKVLWHMRLGVGRRTLNPAVQAWVDAELADAEATLLVLAARRKINRAQAKARAELEALGIAPDGPEPPGAAVELPVEHGGTRGTAVPTVPPPLPAQFQPSSTATPIDVMATLETLVAAHPGAAGMTATELATELAGQVPCSVGTARKYIGRLRSSGTSGSTARSAGGST